MTLIRQSAVIGTHLFAVLGLLLCMAGIAVVLAGKSRLSDLGSAVFGTADEAFVFMETHLDQVSQSLAQSRQRISEVSKLARRLETSGEVAREELEPLRLIIGDVFERLKSAQHWLDSSQAIASGVHRVSQAMATSKAGAADEESAGVTAQRVAEFSEAVADALAKLQAVRQELIEIHEKRQVARELAAAIVARIIELDSKLENLSQRIATFNERVSLAKANSYALGQRIHWWINFAGAMLAIVLVWFGISQIGMMKHATHFARARPVEE